MSMHVEKTSTIHYLRHVSTFVDALHSPGPVVARQKVVHPSGKY